MLSRAWDPAFTLVAYLDEHFSEYSPTTIIAGTITAVIVLQKTLRLYRGWDSKQIKKSLLDKTVRSLEQLPYFGLKVRSEIDKEVNSILAGVKNDVHASRSEWKEIEVLPEEGLTQEEISARFKNLQAHYKAGRLSGAVYAQYEQPFSELLQSVWSETALTNPMHSEWPLINLMEAELVSMCQHLLQGEPGAPGIITHGGSTSILEACKAYVLHARKNGIDEPEIVVPDSAHVAFDKAAAILNVRLVKVPVEEKTGAANVKAMAKAITQRTCMMVGSAPSFPHGIIDPIEDLAKAALRHKLPFHVDSCLGGFLTVFSKEAGFILPPCDFSVPGVSSISIDTHKYGQTPKGTSLLLFSPQNPATTAHIHLDWVGGMYATPSIDGSRSGADIATTWTVLCHKGKREYIEETKAILTLQKSLIAAINKIDGLYVPYNPQLSIIPIQSNKGINSLLIADQLKQAGWSVNILQTPDQRPAGFHFCLTVIHTRQNDFFKEFINALSEAVNYAKTHPEEKPKGMAKAYGKLEKGVPTYIQEKIGKGYLKVLNTLSGFWSRPPEKPALSESRIDRLALPKSKIN